MNGLEEKKREMADKVVSAGFEVDPPFLPGMMARMALGLNNGGWTFSGNTGCGKTTASQWCRWAYNHGKPERERIQFVSAMDIYDRICDLLQQDTCTTEQKMDVYGLTHGNGMHEHGLDMIVDDLGSEPRKTMIFGREVNPMQELIMRRYSAFPRAKTFFTTNLSEAEIKEVYGERCYSRLVEMSPILNYNGSDRRKK